MTPRKFSIIAGIGYLIIFFAAIFANFFVLEAIIKDPLNTIQQDHLMVRLGIIAFLITVVFDVVVAWALFKLYKTHSLTLLSTLFRMMHAVIMGVAIYTLPIALKLDTSDQILMQIEQFNSIWLIGLFFFGIHLMLLGRIMGHPKIIKALLILAGIMYIVDTGAQFLLPSYESYSTIFLALVAIPSIFGEMSFAIWLLLKGGR